MDIEAHPLQWPEGWPRTAADDRADDRRFRGHVYGLTISRARQMLLKELERLGAIDVIISSNVALRQDGVPYLNQQRIKDPGVAVYFTSCFSGLRIQTPHVD